VFNRGADKQDIFSADRDRTLFEALMAEALDRFDIELHAYALMTNHVHLLLRAPDGGVSEAMQRLCGRYGSAYNERTERTGSLFTGRFRSVPITSDAQRTWTGRYIHRNPLDIVIPSALAAYRWSSLGFLLGKWPMPSWLSPDALVGEFPTPDAYLEYVLRPQPSDRLERGLYSPLTTTTCDEIDDAVAAVMDTVDAAVFDRFVRRVDVARMLAVTVAIETRAANPIELAERHGLSDPSSVRRLARRGRVQTSDSDWFAALRTMVLELLIADSRNAA
jgi:REP element-mobilizing transposase RayT